MGLSCRRSPWPILELILLVTAGFPAAQLHAQTAGDDAPDRPWSTRRSYSVFTEYSPDSSHILLGDTGQRLFVTVGGSFSQRLVLNRVWQFSWAPEVRPVVLESDPVQTGFDYNFCFPTSVSGLGLPCTPESGSYRYPQKVPQLNTGIRVQDASFTYEGQTYYQDYAFLYGRRWTWAGGISPIAFRAGFLPGRRLQPILGLTGGFVASPRDIPMFDTSAFNFTFSFGAGFQFWRDRTHATQIEYRIQHLSNADIGFSDPGVDSQMIHVSYVWGRR